MRRSILLVAVGVGLLGQFVGARPSAQADAAPRLTVADLGFLAGKWAGSLEYLDYSDGKSRQKIKAALDCKRAGAAVEYRFSYVEPNGRKVEGDTTRLTLGENGTQLRINDETWCVAGKTQDAKAGKYEVVLTRNGTDDKKPAELRRVLAVEKGTLTIRTEVKPEKAEKAFVRNEYVMKKQ